MKSFKMTSQRQNLSRTFYPVLTTAAVFLTFAYLLVITPPSVHSEGQFTWMKLDQFDDIDNKIRSVNAKNCQSKSKAELVLRRDTVAQLPVYNQLLSRIWYRNRTTLIHIHNMALNRAFFFSYVLQKMNDSRSFGLQPNWMYYYFSTVADVNANPSMLNGSAMYFDNHCHYPNWYVTVPFNKTLPLFGPKAFRWDDYQDQDNWLREPSRQVVKMVDFGAGRDTNYTHAGYKMNPWYNTWLPDIKGDMDSLTKFTYYIGIKRSNQTGAFITDDFDSFAFFGPSSPSAAETDSRKLPVSFTQPYFDCGASNKWIVSAVAPVIDFMPRYSNYTHLRRQRTVGVIVTDTDFIKLDFNACGVSPGNPGPSYLSGVARCRPTTGCKHKMGYGFKRGGYVCVCKSGWRYPWYLDPPYQGDSVEQATQTEYLGGFQCTPSDYRLVLPVVDNLSGASVEGAGGIGAGGRLEEKSGAGRRRRNAERAHKSDINSTTLYRRGHEGAGSASGDGHDLEELAHHNTAVKYSISDMMALAEKLAQIRGEVETKGIYTHQGSGVTMTFETSIEDDYAEKNNVAQSVEKEYQKDVKEHHTLRQALELDYREHGGNLTLTAETLRDSVVRVRDRHIERFQENRRLASKTLRRRKKRAAVYDEQQFTRMMRLLRQKGSVTSSNCHEKPNHQLLLPGDVGYGVHKQFRPEGQTAVRLSNFLSLYLQNVMKTENFGNLRGGQQLHEDQLFGEVLANVMGNFKIYSAGLYFDRYKFQNDDGTFRQFFGPWAFRKRGSYFIIDTAGYSSYYTDEDWFMRAKSRFATNFQGLKTFKIRPYIRSNPAGTSSIRHEYFPVSYRAAPYETGFWTRPHFRCDGHVDAWVMTYVTPFFGLDSLRKRLEFRGVATVDVPLSLLEINQCPQPFTVANAFKNTARCDYLSTKCKPQAGFPFMRGSYRCLCRLGFEYWHMDGKFWFEGSLIELEYEKKRLGIFSRFDHLYCRVSSSPGLSTDIGVIIGALVITIGTSVFGHWSR